LRETPKVVKISLNKYFYYIKEKVEEFIKINPLPSHSGDRNDGIE